MRSGVSCTGRPSSKTILLISFRIHSSPSPMGMVSFPYRWRNMIFLLSTMSSGAAESSGSPSMQKKSRGLSCVHTPAAYSENVGASAGHFPCPDGIWLTDGVEACFQHLVVPVAAPDCLQRSTDDIHTSHLFFTAAGYRCRGRGQKERNAPPERKSLLLRASSNSALYFSRRPLAK